MVRQRTRLLAASLALGLALSACGDDNDVSDTANSLQDEASEAINEGVARAQAEALRGLIKEKAPDDTAEQYVSMTVLEDAIDALPGDPTVTGLTDADNDGKDDDGKLQVEMNGQTACVSISGKDIDVDSNAC